MYHTYILQSSIDGSFYIGHTSNMEQRLLYHNEGKSRYTSRKMPWEIVYLEEFPSKGEAFSFELFLKRQRNTNFYNRLIHSEKNQLKRS